MVIHTGGRGPGHIARVQGGRTTLASLFGSNLVAWFDAQDAASITQSSGAVSQWNDKSGNGNHLTQATAGKKPTYSATGLGGAQPSVSFDGGDVLATAGTVAMGVSSFTALAVCRISASGGASSRVVGFTSGAGNDYDNAASAVLIMRQSAAQTVEGYRTLERGIRAITYDVTFRAASVWDNVNNTMYVNGVAGTPVAAVLGALGATGTLRLGSSPAELAGDTLIGHLCEIGIVNIAASPTQVAAADAMLAAKWTA